MLTSSWIPASQLSLGCWKVPFYWSELAGVGVVFMELENCVLLAFASMQSCFCRNKGDETVRRWCGHSTSQAGGWGLEAGNSRLFHVDSLELN